MTSRLIGLLVSAVAITVLATPAAGQALPRASDGKPDFSGIWQALNTANWNILAHAADKDLPAGLGVVEGGEIPYQPWAAEQQKQNFANRATADPESKCFLPGVPRITYMPYPFQIFQTPAHIAITYEYVHAVRRVFMTGPHPGGIEWFMGDSRGRWEGDTLVVDVAQFTGQTWFDRSGNFHSPALHVVERYTPIDANHINYEVTIEDPNVFTRPWKMSMPLYRRLDPGLRILEHECYAFGLEHTWLKPPESAAQVAAAAGQGAQPPTTPAGGFVPPRTPDGQPDIQGFWNPVGTFYNIQDLEFQALYQNFGSDPARRGKSLIIDPPDGKIPYQPWALAKSNEILPHHADPTPQYLDPNARCFLQGVPRHVNNREFEIFQPPGYFVIFNMAHHAYRAIPLTAGPHISDRLKLWMGDSRGRWEGSTLVVDVANHNDQTWFDVVGSFHSDALHVSERFVPINADTIEYTAVITDPKVYTRPWTMKLTFERIKDYGSELYEEACFETNERTLELMLTRPGR